MASVFARILLGLVVPLFTHAESSLTLIVINESTKNFTLERVEKRSNNTIVVSQTSCAKGERVTVIGTTTPSSDLVATVYFSNDARLTIVDQRQFHYGQPRFTMAGPSITSTFTATQNPVIAPRALKIDKATVIVRDEEDTQLPSMH